MAADTKRLFFGLEVAAPWPEILPEGRVIPESSRHVTLAFLGNVSYEISDTVPIPRSPIGPVGRFKRCLFLPPRRPNVVAWEVEWSATAHVLEYQQQLVHYLRNAGFSLDEREFLPHVTLARWPLDRLAWSRLPYSYPVVGRAVHLYESVGNLEYTPRWSYPLLAPFEEIAHTADVAFLVRGENLGDLLLHAQIALTFVCPAMLEYASSAVPRTLDEVIIELNRLIGQADGDIGVPFKAVSFHGEVLVNNGLLSWEMIVDV